MVSVIIPYFGLASLFTSIKHPVNKKQCTVKIHTSARVKISGPMSTWSINHHRWLKMLQCAVVIGLKAESPISSGLNALKRCYPCIQKEHAKPLRGGASHPNSTAITGHKLSSCTKGIQHLSTVKITNTWFFRIASMLKRLRTWFPLSYGGEMTTRSQVSKTLWVLNVNKISGVASSWRALLITLTSKLLEKTECGMN